MILATEEFFVM